MKLKNLLWIPLTCALLLAPAGCIFSPDEGGDGGGVDEPLPWASTPTILMDNFKTIYNKMLIDEFEAMLHDDYKTILLAETLTEWGWEADYYFNKSEESTIHRNMFSGNTGLRSDGVTVVNPIDRIDVQLLEVQEAWADISAGDQWFGGVGGQFANYQVRIFFYDAYQHAYEVNQSVNFYAIPVDVDGREKWLMLGQRGLSLD